MAGAPRRRRRVKGGGFVGRSFVNRTAFWSFARAWFLVRRELPYQLLDFLDDANKRGVLRYAGPRFEFEGTTRFAGTSATRPGSQKSDRRSPSSLTGHSEIQKSAKSYRHVGADRSDIEQAIGSLATETIMAGRSSSSLPRRARRRLNGYASGSTNWAAGRHSRYRW